MPARGLRVPAIAQHHRKAGEKNERLNAENQPLLLSSLLRHADRFHGDIEIVSCMAEGPIHRETYKDAARRARKLADTLRQFGGRQGNRIGTLAWNNYRH
jgi:acyl-CoA synthetase (AMP-forming)/AMP-acid ligase II